MKNHLQILNQQRLSDVCNLDISIVSAPSDFEGCIWTLGSLLDRRPHPLGEFIFPCYLLTLPRVQQILLNVPDGSCLT